MSWSFDLFGSIRLGYVVVESVRFAEWRRFLGDGIGLHLAKVDGECQVWRVDEHSHRLVIERGEAEDVSALGWQVASEAAMDELLRRLDDRGMPIAHVTGPEAAARGVTEYWRIVGPKGLPLEYYVTPLRDSQPLKLGVSGFETGAGGLGHVALTSRRPEATRRFWQELCDARFSDHIEQPIGGLMLDIDFLRLNERHHSIAIAATRGMRLDPIRTKIQHLNLQVSQLEDLTGAYVRLKKLGYRMAHLMGQHPNDLELSFYAISPSGFEMEIGWNPIAVNESEWEVGEHFGMSSWGHELGKNKTLTNLGNMKRGIGSLLRHEYSPLDPTLQRA